MYKVTIQNINQIYFSLQDHRGKRISLSQYEMRVFQGLTSEEANKYKKYIPLGLSVLIQEDTSFIPVDFEVIEVDNDSSDINDVSPLMDDTDCEGYTKEYITSLKKDELKDICDDLGIDTKRKTKIELVNSLVDYYGL